MGEKRSCPPSQHFVAHASICTVLGWETFLYDPVYIIYTVYLYTYFFRNDFDPKQAFLDLAALLNLRVKLLIQV